MFCPTSLTEDEVDRSKAVVLLWFSVACFWCQSFGGIKPYVSSYHFSSTVLEAKRDYDSIIISRNQMP